MESGANHDQSGLSVDLTLTRTPTNVHQTLLPSVTLPNSRTRTTILQAYLLGPRKCINPAALFVSTSISVYDSNSISAHWFPKARIHSNSLSQDMPTMYERRGGERGLLLPIKPPITMSQSLRNPSNPPCPQIASSAVVSASTFLPPCMALRCDE